MSATQPLRSAHFLEILSVPIRKVRFANVLLLCVTLLICASAHAQTTLVTVATDQSPLNLSNHFGVPLGGIVNQAGDYAFLGNGGTAGFLRRHGTAAAARLLQAGDPVPGFPGSQVLFFNNGGGINSSGHIVFAVRFSSTDGLGHTALETYDGTSFHTVVSSTDIAPGTGGKTYGPRIIPVGINDNGDVAFTAEQPLGGVGTGGFPKTLFIVPSGGLPVRVLGVGDAVPGGVPAGTIHKIKNVREINALGQVLLDCGVLLTAGGGKEGFFVGSATGVVQKVVVGGDPAPGSLTFSFLGSAVLNKSGLVAFSDVNGTWLWSSPSTFTLVAASGAPAPASIGGGTLAGPFPQAIDDTGDILITTGIIGGTSSGALLRYHTGVSPPPPDVVAFNGQVVGGKTFQSVFFGTMANNGIAAFFVQLTSGFGIYQQISAGAPALIVTDGQPTSLQHGGNFSLSKTFSFPGPPFTIPTASLRQVLNNGSVYFSSGVSSSTAYYGEFLGAPAPGIIQNLMSTDDTLPAGARVTFNGGFDTVAAGHFVAFSAQQAGGPISVFVTDRTSGTTTKLASEGDPAPGLSGAFLGQVSSLTAFVNSSGQVAFGTSLLGGGAGQGIFTGSPSSALAKVAATGDAAPGSSVFTFVQPSGNYSAPSMLNDSGQVAFLASTSFGQGIFLFSPGGVGIAQIAALGAAAPGGGFFTAFADNSSQGGPVAVNAAGQIAFGADTGVGSGLFIGSASGPPQKVVATGDILADRLAGGTVASLLGLSSFNDSGVIAFAGSVTNTIVTTFGLFDGQASSAIPNPTLATLALDGDAAPGTTAGTFQVLDAAANLALNNTSLGYGAVQVNNEDDVVFRSGVTGGTAASGYFRILHSAPTLQAIVLQGQTVPGSLGTFAEIPAPSYQGQFFALGPQGAIAFSNAFVTGSATKRGDFGVTAGGTMFKIIAGVDTVPGTGGGVLSFAYPELSSDGTGGFAFIADASGGTAREAVLWTNTPVPTVTATAGTPQSTQVNTPFPTNLQATVRDALGNPASGVTVTFTVNPATNGASGTFTGANTAVTNGSGIATANTFTANTKAGSYTVTASATGAISAAFHLTNTPGPPATVGATGGTPQSATINTAFALALQATVTDALGNLVSGVLVTFTAPAQTGPSGTFAGGVNTAVTNASGVATSATFTANSHAGGFYNVSASVLGVGTPAIFSLRNMPGPPATITATGGTPQNAPINTAFALPLQATVKDSGGNPLPSVIVTFTVSASRAKGTFAGGVNTAVTSASGVATSVTFTANAVPGSYTVTATAGAVGPANFNLTNTAGAAATITATGGTPQSAVVNTAFASPLQATVKDGGGNPVPGVTVTFTVPGSGASGTFAGGMNTAITNASGIATANTFTANNLAGVPYTVTATVAGVATPANFSLTNTVTAPATITATGGTPQSAAINTAFALPLLATVRDSNSNPVPGVTVTFTVSASRAKGTFAGGMNTAVTNASGAATSAVFTANSAVGGPYAVTASVAGVATLASFSLTNTAGGAATIKATGGTSQSAVINTAFASPLRATVRDAVGNRVSGVTVTFTVPGSGASGAFAGGVNTAVTDASGVATSATFTANSLAGGPYTVTATAGAVGPANFSLTNTATAPATITATGGTPQSAVINTAFALPLLATVKDGGGSPVPGVTVTFTAPPSRASGRFAGGLSVNTAVTNASGVATSVTFTANGIAGGYTVTATAGALGPANFSLTNTLTAAPTITSTVPANNATGVGINQAVNATFSKAMDPLTISTATFTLVTGNAPVTGTVAYDVPSHIATFTPLSNLAPNATYTATISTGVKDVAGNALTSGAVPNPWMFTTGTATTGQAPINLRSASTFAVMATSAITSTGSVVINGDVGLSPGTFQGIPSAQVNGTIHVNDPIEAQAKADLLAAYNDAISRSTNAQTLPGNLGGLTITPGLYVNSSSVLISGSGPGNNVTLDAQGDANAVFIFKMSSTLTTGPGAQVILAGGAKAGNVFWQVGSSATIDTTTIFKGNILAAASVTLNTGSVVNGRVFAGAAGSAASATVNAATVTVPAP